MRCHASANSSSSEKTKGPASWSISTSSAKIICLFARALPDTKVFYAVKANPAPEILKLLVELGSCFDVASVSETQAVLAAGATPDRISHGNTIKKESEISAVAALGVSLFAVDCEAEVEKVARCAPGSRVICRIHCDGSGSEWPLSRKFGCEPDYAPDILELASEMRARTARRVLPRGLPAAQRGSVYWDRALASTAAILQICAERGSISPWSISVAAFPPAMCARRRSSKPMVALSSGRCASILAMQSPETIVEPGRGLVGNAGIIEAEVVLIAKRSPEDEVRSVLTSRHRQVPWPCRNNRRVHSLSHPHRPGSGRDRALHHRGAHV